MDEFTQLGNAIKEARLKKGMSQEALAEALDISPTHVKHMESGHRRPSVEKLFQIAKLLDMSVDSVIFKKDSKEAPVARELGIAISSCTDREKQVLLDVATAMRKHR